MRIPAFGLGGTPTPYTFVEESTKGQRDATATAGRAQAIEAAALADAGQTMMNVGKDVYAFTKRIEEQEALTYVQSKRAAAEIEGTKAVGEWEGTVSGPDALKATGALQERLGKLKQSLLEDAPSERAKQYAAQDIDVRMAHFQVAGEKFARAKFKEHAATVQDQADQQLFRAAYFTRDPAQLQSVLDQGKAAYMAHGVNGIWISPADAEIAAGKFENKAVVAHIQGKLDDPKFARQAIAEIRGGVWADKLDVQQIVKLGNMADATEKHMIAEGRRAQAEARAALGERQDKLAYSIWEDIKANPEAARAKYDLKTISALVDSGKLRAGQAQHFYDMAQGTIRQSDPVVKDGLLRAAARGELTREMLLENEKHLSGGDYLNLTEWVGRSELQQPDAKSALEEVRILFNSPLAKNSAKNDEKFRAKVATATTNAQDHIKKRVQAGVPAKQALYEAILEFDPEDSSETGNKRVPVRPENPADMAPAFKQLHDDLVAGRIDKNKFASEWRALDGIRKSSESRQILKDKIESFKRKEGK